MNDLYLKLTGSVNIPEELEIRKTYHVSIEGTVISKLIQDNEDNSESVYYKFSPTLVEILKPTGEIIKAKDKRKDSQLTRLAIRGYHLDNNLQEDEEDFYHRVQVAIRHNLDSIIKFLKI
jgi:hypothetical protein